MKSKHKILGFNDFWLTFVGIPVVALLTSAMMFADVLLEKPEAFFGTCFFVGLGYTLAYWLIFRYLCVFFRRKFPLPKDTAKRLGWLALTVTVIFFALQIALDPILHPALNQLIGDKKPEHEISMTIGSLLVTFLVLGIYEILGFRQQLQTVELEKERLLKENVHSQLESLRNQVNPHFFFNSLNTLAYLIPEDPEKAVNFVRKLSQTYRYILDIRDKQLATLEEELEFLKAFISLLKERFGENLQVEVAVQPELMQRRMMPLALQMLIENAIKHNVVSAQHPLHLEIRSDGANRLVVKNNLHRKNQPEPGAGLGLENIRNRYRLVGQQQVEVVETPQEFLVFLPLLKE
ncbi:MAG: histidine kinase [Bacteroidota bacterium]